MSKHRLSNWNANEGRKEILLAKVGVRQLRRSQLPQRLLDMNCVPNTAQCRPIAQYTKPSSSSHLSFLQIGWDPCKSSASQQQLVHWGHVTEKGDMYVCLACLSDRPGPWYRIAYWGIAFQGIKVLELHRCFHFSRLLTLFHPLPLSVHAERFSGSSVSTTNTGQSVGRTENWGFII